MVKLSFEDRDFVQCVLRVAAPQWSNRERQCVILMLRGYTQEEIAKILGIGQPRVVKYQARALRKVREIAKVMGIK